MPTTAPELGSAARIRIRWRVRLPGRWGAWTTTRLTLEEFWSLIAATAKGQAQMLLVEGG